MSELVPDGWTICKIKEVADLSDRYSFTGGPFGSDLKSEDYTETGVRIIQLQNIGDGVFKNKYKIYTSESKADQLHSCNIYPDDIILSKMGDPVARATIIPRFSARYVMASDGIRLSVNKEKFDTKFVHDTINAEPFRTQAELNSTGSTRKRIGLTQLRELTFISPPLPEQQKIAAILTSVDKVIEKTQAQIDKLKDLKTAMMQELLTCGVGVDGKPHTEFKDSPVGMIPKKWDVIPINQLVSKVGSGVTPRGGSSAYVEIGTPLIRSQNVHTDGLRLENVSFITDEQHKRMLNSQLKAKDVLLNITGASIGRCYYLPDDFGEGNVNQHVCIIRTNVSQLNHVYLSLVLNSEFGQRQIMSLQAGGNREGLNFQQIRAIKLPVPPLNEQIKIAEILTSIESKLKCHNLKLSATQNTKKALMQDLLTGKVRVTVPAPSSLKASE
jgi:type I restriction enzyme S subunit